jgi:hypothetical protein
LNFESCPYDVIKVIDYQKTQPTSNELKIMKKIKNASSNLVNKKQAQSIKLERVYIDAYCGRKLNFTVFSTNNLFDLEFEMFDSLGNEEYSDDETKILLRKGFKAFFMFSKDFVDLSFITGTHITGTSKTAFYL